MDNVLAFLVLTAALSMLQVWECYRAISFGAVPSSIDWSFAFIEFAWVIVSIAIIYYGNLSRYELLVPAAYLLLSLYGWIVGYWYVKETDILANKIIYIPQPYLWFSLIFGCFLTLLTIFVFTDSYLYRNDLSIQSYILTNKVALIWIFAIVVILKSVIDRLKKFVTDTVDQLVKNAIENNVQCREYFGNVLSIKKNSEISVQLEMDAYGYHVRGSKSRGFLVGKFIPLNSEEELLSSGYIATEDGLFIDLIDQALEA